MKAEAQVLELIDFARRELPAMRLSDGMYCLEVRARDMRPRGRSIRYSAMVALGLLRARAAGYDVEDGLDDLVDRLLVCESEQLTPGDLGLLLWLDRRAGRERAPDLLDRLGRSLRGSGSLAPRDGMEVAWIAIGASECVRAGVTPHAESLLSLARDELIARSNSPSGLLFHRGPGSRRRFPNFATQIYGVLALSALVRQGDGDAEALAAARQVADVLLRHQRPNGGWPWLFDAERGRVVEPYQIYSVHQDAMGPMGLLELFEASGEDRYRAAAARGLRWIYGENELGVSMLDHDRRILYRSIRRRLPWNRLILYSNTIAACVNREMPSSRASLEINATDRPYHLGWVLDAWCGREALAG